MDGLTIQHYKKMTLQQIKVVRLLASAIIDSVAASGHTGAPGGHLYAALMAHGISLNQFEQIMSALVREGYLRKEGHVYFASGKEFNPAMPAAPSAAPVATAPRGWDSVGGAA